jgi:hypothetical protein
MLKLVYLALGVVPGTLVLRYMLRHKPGYLLARVVVPGVVPGVSRHAIYLHISM